MEKMKLSVALKKFIFGEGCPSSTILAEYKQLTQADKDWFAKQFAAEGLAEVEL